ncbi:uncharacterized protein LOC135839970 [Planococcus citri]|uniref:uncharacterized protein LOC135839970 n=1 Tax=Planococcus citri TaxID=170843 RepID=UPI0031FA3C52
MAFAAKMIFFIAMTVALFSSIHCDIPVAVAAPAVVAPYASSYSAHSINHAIAPAAPVVAAYSAGVPAAYSAYSGLPYPYAAYGAYPYYF